MSSRFSLLLLGLLVVPSAAAASEGRFIALDAGDSASWPPSEGRFYLYVLSGGSGAALEPAGFTQYGDTGRVEPGSWSLRAVELPHGGGVKLTEGDAIAALVRADLDHSGSVFGERATIGVSGPLSEEDCRVYSFFPHAFGSMGPGSVTSGPIWVNATGAGVEFRVATLHLEWGASQKGSLSVPFDDQREHGLLLQACNSSAGAREFEIIVTRVYAPLDAGRAWVPQGPILALAAFALAAMVSRRA